MSLQAHLQHLLATQRQRFAADPAAPPAGVLALALPLLDALQAHDPYAVADLLDDLGLAREQCRLLRHVLRAADLRATLYAPDGDPALQRACNALVAALEQPGGGLPAQQPPATSGAITTGNVAGQGVAIGDGAQASSQEMNAEPDRAVTREWQHPTPGTIRVHQ